MLSEAVKYSEVMKVIQETLNLEQVKLDEAPAFAEAQADRSSRRQQTALPLSKGVVNAAAHFENSLRELPSLTVEDLRRRKNREIPRFPRSYAGDHPLYAGTLGREAAVVRTTYEQLSQGRHQVSDTMVTTKTLKGLEKLSREQIMACSHIDLQLKTVQLLNEGVLNSLAPGSREFTGLNKSKAILAAAGRSVGALNHMSTHALGVVSLLRRDDLLAKVPQRVPAPELNALRQSKILSEDLFDPDQLSRALKLDQELAAKSKELKSITGSVKNTGQRGFKRLSKGRGPSRNSNRGVPNTVTKQSSLPAKAPKAEVMHKVKHQAPFCRGREGADKNDSR